MTGRSLRPTNSPTNDHSPDAPGAHPDLRHRQSIRCTSGPHRPWTIRSHVRSCELGDTSSSWWVFASESTGSVRRARCRPTCFGPITNSTSAVAAALVQGGMSQAGYPDRRELPTTQPSSRPNQDVLSLPAAHRSRVRSRWVRGLSVNRAASGGGPVGGRLGLPGTVAGRVPQTAPRTPASWRRPSSKPRRHIPGVLSTARPRSSSAWVVRRGR
jgi:hypothetical protein